MEQKLISTQTLISALLFALVFGLFSQPAGAQQFVTLNYPGSTSTTPYGINNLEVAVGYYSLSDGSTHAFRYSQGAFTNIDFPAAASSHALAINDNGDVVGFYADNKTGALHGFLLHVGTYTTIDYPGATTTVAGGINNAGEIAGSYSMGGVTNGFLLVSGNFSSFAYPGAIITAVYGINNLGTVAGSYYNSIGGVFGFEYNSSTNSFTNVVTYPGALQTFVTGINDNGLLVGVVEQTSNQVFQGFTYLNGEFSLIGAAPAPFIYVFNLGVNNSAQIVGGSNDIVNGQRNLGNGFFLQAGAHIVTTIQSLTLNALGTQYVATLSLSNTGSLPASGVLVTSSKLNGFPTLTALPVNLSTIGGNNPATVTLTYPISAGAPGHPGVLTVSESYSGGSSGAGMRVVLP